jgi:hypothetical protein
MDPGDELYDAKVKVLGEQVRHHIEEEEDELYQIPLIRTDVPNRAIRST